MLYDRDIRPYLYDFLDEKYPRVRTFDEKIIGKSRSDIFAVIDGALIGFEIKSDADTYTRLPAQIKSYDKFFDFNYIVVGKSHARQVDKHVPAHWGIIAVDDCGNVSFDELRPAEPNPKAKVSDQLRFLWRRELISALKKCGLPGYSSKSRSFSEKVLVERVSPEKIKAVMTEELFERDYTTLAPPKPRTVKRSAKRARRKQS